MFRLFLILLIVNGCASASQQEVTDSKKSQVMVVGFAHLNNFSKKSLSKIGTLNNLLKQWEPTKVAIEHRPSEDIRKTASRSLFDKDYENLLSYFDGKDVKFSKKVSEKYKLTYPQAQKLLNELSNQKRLSFREKEKIIKAFIVTYDWPNAVYYWSLLNKKERNQVNLNSDSVQHLNKLISSHNEIYSVAIPIAKSLGHKKLYAVDYQEDGISMLKIPREKLEKLHRHPEAQEFQNLPFIKKEIEITKDLEKTGEIVKLIEYVNIHSKDYDRQWDWYFKVDDPEGILKLRYANWERRNLKMASRVQDIASTQGAERILFIVGVSHKVIVERYLSLSRSIQIVDFDKLKVNKR